ncbi:7860_t:CDS:2, partial [Entrophospora sp. SA101]
SAHTKFGIFMFRSISQVMFSNGVEADGLTDEQFKGRLPEANIINISEEKCHIIDQELFNNSGLIKEIIKIKLMQLQAGFGVQLDKDMDEIPTPLL